MKLALVNCRNLILEVVPHCSKLSFPGPDGPLDCAVHLLLLNRDVDRSSRGSPEISNLVSNLLELRRCVALECNSQLAVDKFINDAVHAIHHILCYCLARNWQSTYRFGVCIIHDGKRFLESQNCLNIWPCIL